jgi:hypothetical protein
MQKRGKIRGRQISTSRSIPKVKELWKESISPVTGGFELKLH